MTDNIRLHPERRGGSGQLRVTNDFSEELTVPQHSPRYLLTRRYTITHPTPPPSHRRPRGHCEPQPAPGARRRKPGRNGSAGEEAEPWGASKEGLAREASAVHVSARSLPSRTAVKPQTGRLQVQEKRTVSRTLPQVTPGGAWQPSAPGRFPPLPPAARGVLALLHDPREDPSAPGGCQASTGHT